MRKEYDLSKLKFKKNPYAKRLKKQITIRLDSEIIDYFKGIGEENDVSYQSLINLYLRELKSIWYLLYHSSHNNKEIQWKQNIKLLPH